MSDNIKDTDGFKEIDADKDGKLSRSEIEAMLGAGVSQPRGSEPVQEVVVDKEASTSAEIPLNLRDNAQVLEAIKNTPLPETLDFSNLDAREADSSDMLQAPTGGAKDKGAIER